MDQRIETQLGNYWIAEVIARGTFGIVYRAEHMHLGHSVAIKFIHAYLNTPQQQASFRQEAQMLVKLRHPNIVRLHDFGIDDDCPYLVSEYASGGSLRDYLVRQASQPLPLRDARHILAQVGYALAYVHSQGIIHRDLKPENILFDRDGNALLADFGIARVKQTASASGVGSAASVVGLGTPPYMAPEQFKGKGEPLPQSDQYALGCIAYELLTGQLPFTADNIAAYGYQHMYEFPEPLRLHNPTLPPSVEQAVLTALAKDTAKRHADVEAFLVALGIRRPAPTQTDLTSDTTAVVRSAAMSGSDDPTFVKQPKQTRTVTERSPRGLVSSSQHLNPMLPRATVPIQSTPTPTTTRPASSSFQTTGSARRTTASDILAEIAPTRQIPSLWKRVQALVASASALTIAKRLFLLAALIDLLLLLGGFWLGPGPLALIGTILAIGICVCGLALNFFTEPWIWMVVFLLLSPLAGALYTFAVNIHADPSIMNWHTFCAYLLLTPAAGILYGVFGSTKHRDESMTPSFTKKLTLTVWFLGAGIFAVGFAAQILIYIGLAWALASGILAVAQIIRLKQWGWLGNMVFGTAFALGVPVFVWGFVYGVFGPTTENEQQ